MNTGHAHCKGTTLRVARLYDAKVKDDAKQGTHTKAVERGDNDSDDDGTTRLTT